MKIIRLMCTGRVDLSFIMRAFLDGADGVFIGGCKLGECHYVTEGNFDALSNVFLGRRLLKHIGINPARLRVDWISASEGNRFAEVVDEFVGQLKGFGPIGTSEGISQSALALNFETISSMIPYIKLVERERFRIPVKSEEAYTEFYTSDELGRLFKELIADKLMTSQIMLLLKKKPLSTGEIAEVLKLTPSEVSRHVSNSSKQGLIRYDADIKRYAPI